MNLTITPNVTNNKTKTAKVNKQQSFGMRLGNAAKWDYKIIETGAKQIELWDFLNHGKLTDRTSRIILAGIDVLKSKPQPKYELCEFKFENSAGKGMFRFGIRDLSDDTIVEKIKSPKGSIKFLKKLQDDDYVAKLMKKQRDGTFMQRIGRLIGGKSKQTATVKN